MDVSSLKGIFFRYIFMPLMIGILVFIMSLIRKSRPAIKIKHIIIYVLICGLLLALPGIFGVSGNLFNPYWYLVCQVIYLIFGIFHVNLLHNYFRKHFTVVWKSALFEFILTVTCMLFGGYLFKLLFEWIGKEQGNAVMAATSMITFLIPLAFYYCYINFISIPYNIYKTWRISPDQQPHDFRGVDFDKLMVLNVELSKKLDDSQRFLVKAKTVPSGVTFGDWFYRVVDDYNHKNPGSTIQITDQNNEPFYWIFYVKKSFFSKRKYVDFEQDITENGISENEIIICKRVIHNQEEGRMSLQEIN